MNNYYIPSRKADLDEDGLPCIEGHDCLDFLKLHSSTAMEPHGETFHDEWYECSVCHERYTDDDVERMYTGAECVACGSERKTVVTERILAHTPASVCCGEVA